MIPNSYTFEHNVQMPTMQYVINLKLWKNSSCKFFYHMEIKFLNII